MVTGDPGALGDHVTPAQAKNTNPDLVIIQQPRMEVLLARGHHQCMKIVSFFIGLERRHLHNNIF